jgi:CRP/FNR family transcriptional regulator, cyclic AMP receptor protein
MGTQNGRHPAPDTDSRLTGRALGTSGDGRDRLTTPQRRALASSKRADELLGGPPRVDGDSRELPDTAHEPGARSSASIGLSAAAATTGSRPGRPRVPRAGGVRSVRSAVSLAAALVLELDPDLGAGVQPEDWEAARQACRGDLLSVPQGRWRLPEAAGDRDDILGLVIVEGLLCREVSLQGRHMLELLGRGDVLQLPVLASRPGLGGRIELTAVTDVGLVVLGKSFIHAAARWPSLLAAVTRRLETQRENLAIQALIAHLPRAEQRLLMTLWHLAERFGRVTPQGTVLPLPFGHEVLGQLIGARRPTATLALGALAAQDVVRRLEDGSWLLTAAAARRIEAILPTSDCSPVLGEQLTLPPAAQGPRAEAWASALRPARYERSPSGRL